MLTYTLVHVIINDICNMENMHDYEFGKGANYSQYKKTQA